MKKVNPIEMAKPISRPRQRTAAKVTIQMTFEQKSGTIILVMTKLKNVEHTKNEHIYSISANSTLTVKPVIQLPPALMDV